MALLGLKTIMFILQDRMSALLTRQYELMACLDAKTVAKTMGLSLGERLR